MLTQPVLFVLSSHEADENGVLVRGFRFEELAMPYYILQDEGIAVELASRAGNVAHPDPDSHDRRDKRRNPAAVNRFINDLEAMYKLHNTRPLGSYTMENYSALYLVGIGQAGQVQEEGALQRLIDEARAQNKTISCGSLFPAVLSSRSLQAIGESLRERVMAAAPPAPFDLTAEGVLGPVAEAFSHNLSI